MSKLYPLTEEYESQLSAMIADHNDTWDLSPNDRAALIAVRAELGRLRAKLAAALALTDTGSAEFREMFKGNVPAGWRVLEKIREILLG